MLTRNALVSLAGAAIFALDASASHAQDTTRISPRSATRIPIRKEAAGEVVRIDTVFSYKTDTLRLPGKTDTVVTTKTETIVRVDTVNIPVPQFLQQIGGFYFGLGGGSSLPAANFNDSDKPGWRVEGLIGVDPIGSPLGVRLTGSYAGYQPHSYLSPFLESAKIGTVTLDAKLRMLTISPLSQRVHVYGIAGGSYNRFKNILENDHGTLSVGSTVFPSGVVTAGTTIDSDWHSG
ncbi:MAG TPA: hypothetical protein VIP11_25315, partial [Gemmatimonadaceae bacterium]